MVLLKQFVAWLVLLLFVPFGAFAKEPNDPLFDQWSYKEVQAYDAWNYTTGSRNVVVAIIDNGFDHFHPDLAKNVWKNVDEVVNNGIDDDANGYIDDVWGWSFVPQDSNADGLIDEKEALGSNDPRPPVLGFDSNETAGQILHHGTVVAGIIGAVGNNSELGAGINWNVQLMNVRLLGNEGRGEATALERAIIYAVDNGADVINFSIVSNTFSDAVKQAIDYAYEKGVVIVAAAGNGGTSLNSAPLYPICADTADDVVKILGVSAIRQDRRIASFSNYGSDCIDITAPGVDINSTLRYAPLQGFSDAYGEGWSGTSFATPFVSGTAALIKALRPEWKAKEIYHAILSTTHKTPPQDETNYTNLYGRGLLQIHNALAFAQKQGGAIPSLPSIQQPSAPVVAPKTEQIIQMVSLAEGLIRIKYPRQLFMSTTKDVPELKGMDDVSMYESQTAYWYVASKYSAATSQTHIKIFDTSWSMLHEWSVSTPVAMRVVLADVQSTGIPQVVMAPHAKANELFRIYTQEGELIDTQESNIAHRGVVVSSMRSASARKDDIILAYRSGEHPTIARYGGVDTKLAEFESEQFRDPGAISSADLNGDGVKEFVVVSAETEDIMMVYYRADGQLLRNFPSYAPGTKIDLALSVADYNGDGKEDIITTATQGTAPMQIWSYQPTLLFHLPIIEKSLAPIRMFITSPLSS